MEDFLDLRLTDSPLEQRLFTEKMDFVIVKFCLKAWISGVVSNGEAFNITVGCGS